MLDERGCVGRDELLDLVCLSDFDFFTGLGWLACEGKIALNEGVFCLGEGVSSGGFGGFAGRVWRVLDVWGDADFVTLKRLTGLDDVDVDCGLGWLGREGKLVVLGDRFSLK